MAEDPDFQKLSSKASIKSKKSTVKDAAEDDGWGDDDDGDQWGADEMSEEDAWAETAPAATLQKGLSAVVSGPYRVLTMKDIEGQIPKHVK